jgi:hypothetical protein
MDPLTWGTIATLVAKYGVPFVEQLLQNASNNKPVTMVEWAGLVAKIEVPFDVLVPLKLPPVA